MLINRKNQKIYLRFIISSLLIIFIYVAYKHIKTTPIRNFNKDYYNYLYNTKKVKAATTEDLNLQKSKKHYMFNNISIPVLMYHSIGHASLNPFVIAPSKFKAEMKYLKENNYNTISIDQFYDFIINNEPIPKKSVLITFDDGYKDNYTIAYPILKKYEFKATIFVVTNYLNKGHIYLKSAQLKEMHKNGIDIESHTFNHDKLSKLSYSEQLKTLRQSKKDLENIMGYKIDYLAYPFGKYNLNSLRACKAAGYKLAFTTEGKWTNKLNGILTLHRVFASGFSRLISFEKRVQSPYYIFKEFYY